MQRESMSCDVLIVGAGPSGLATAIHLAQQSKEQPLNICVLEKGSAIGAHILSGAVMDPSALTELIPDWQQKQAPVSVKVTRDFFYYLSQSQYYSLPVPKLLQNDGNYIISLGELCQWLAQQAESLGVNIFPGFAASKILMNEDKTAVTGVQTGDMGLDQAGNPTDRFQAGMDLFAEQTIFAEGARGSLSQQVMQHFNLRNQCQPQSYGIGIKELWQIPEAKHREGEAIHTIGWPLKSDTYGGGFIYHFKERYLVLGLVIGLDYQNPYLDPFKELQRLKHHPYIKPLLENAECIRYGARAINEGGLQSLPQLTFPGGLLVGCAAGMVNVGKIKGIHNAIRSGMLAAKSIIANRSSLALQNIQAYQQAFNQSPIYRELYQVRNLRPGFHRGLWLGLTYAALDQYVLRGKAPWTWGYRSDHSQLKLKSQSQPIDYPKPDGKISFDKLTQVYLTATKHRENEPCHLYLKDPTVATQMNLTKYAGPEARYCPAGVYEFIEKEGQMTLQINSANCIHCKTCDIKDPTQNIIWKTPEGGEGPNYTLM